MEIKPLKTYVLPKFALALAAAAVAGTMTACGPIETGGDVAMSEPDRIPAGTDVQLDGEEAVSEMPETETTETAAETTEITTKTAETMEPEEECVELAGDVDVMETQAASRKADAPGMVFSPDDFISDYSESIQAANQQAAAFEQEFQAAFAEKGVELVRSESADTADMPWRSTGVPKIELGFYDSEAEVYGRRAGDVFRGLYCKDIDRWFDWGFVRTYGDADGNPEELAIRIDIRSCGTMTAELAAQIAQEALQ